MERAADIGEVILEVPLDRTLSDADAASPPLAGVCEPWARGLPPHTQLALTLIRERRLRQQSAWAAYLASIPARVCLPKDMRATELAHAQDVAFEREAESGFCGVHEAFDDAIDAWLASEEAEPSPSPNPAASLNGEAEGGVREPPCSAEEFQWAMGLVWTRCLRLDTGDSGVRRLLVPCVDMANHNARPSAFFASAHSAGAAAVRLHAARKLAPGDAVTLSYGEGSAAYWAQHYGFIPEPNPYDSVPIFARDLALEPALLEAEDEEWGLRATGVDTRLFGKLRSALLKINADRGFLSYALSFNSYSQIIAAIISFCGQL